MKNAISARERKDLAALIGVNEQYLYQCLTGRRDMRPAKAVEAEAKTKGRLTRQMLCQGTYAQTWPDLKSKTEKAQAAREGRASKKVSAEAL